MNIHTYPKIYALGHAAISELLYDDVVVQEKVDGSQFSFCIEEDGVLRFRSKRCEVHPQDSGGMFKPGVESISDIKDSLHPGWTYRGEYLRIVKHNVLCYGRLPSRHVIIFDINPGGIEHYLSTEEIKQECDRIGLECVPTFYQGKIDNFNQLENLLKTDSILGRSTIEGIVIKNYFRFGKDKKVLMGKWVRDEVAEKIAGNKNFSNSSKHIIMRIGEKYKTEARWQKAIQHLKEQGLISNEPKDIGPLLKEINDDVLSEEFDTICKQLFKWAWGDISRIITRGFPEWYKGKLAEKQFDVEDSL